MIIEYQPIDGYSITPGSAIAVLMSDSSSTMKTNRVVQSPLMDMTENGTLTYSATATNSTTLWCDGVFASGNNFHLAYTSSLDPGTNGVNGKAWFDVLNNVGPGYVFDRAFSSGAYYSLYMFGDGTFIAAVYDGTTTRTVQSDAAYDDGKAHQVAFTFDGSTLKLFIDGRLVKRTTGTALNSLSNASAELYIGRTYSNNNYWDGSLAGIEIQAGNTWSDAEVLEKYNLEKVLFKRDELFSILGEEIQYTPNIMLPFTRSFEIDDRSTQSRAAVREGYTNYRKRVYQITMRPFLNADLPKALKFLKSTNLNEFTIDVNGDTSNSPIYDDPIQVYKTSRDEQITFNNPYHNLAFSVREK